MGHVVAPATPDMEIQADALASCCMLISLGGDRSCSISIEAVIDALHKEFNVPLHLITILRHIPENFLAKFVHPHHQDDVIDEGNFEHDHLQVHPKPWIMEGQVKH
ncbi:hypothetical protein ZWY2020_057094 [Hordeum vulgare]|nr:hypothetical protein ZWY2020_057094 [Hordeum vulgare]